MTPYKLHWAETHLGRAILIPDLLLLLLDPAYSREQIVEAMKGILGVKSDKGVISVSAAREPA